MRRHPLGGPSSSSNSMESASGGSGSKNGGRIVRLHFACRAPLPIGSSLRVTGSTLWAPASSAHSLFDASEQANASSASSAVIAGNSNAWCPHDEAYASSVEMVTSPDMYPVWKTRTPVVLSIHPHNVNNSGNASSGGSAGEQPPPASAAAAAAAAGGPAEQQARSYHHRYRYLVVTPGADIDDAALSPDLLPTSREASSSTGGTPRSGNVSPVNNMSDFETVTDEDSDVESAAAAAAAAAAGSKGYPKLQGQGTVPTVPPLGMSPPSEKEFLPLSRENSLLSAGGGGASSAISASYGSGGTGGLHASTSNDTGDGSFPVTLWEDPFQSSASQTKKKAREMSFVSLPSVRDGRTNAVKSLANLPFRTLDIDMDHPTEAGLRPSEVEAEAGAKDVAMSEHQQTPSSSTATTEYTEDGVRIDVWNNVQESAWKSYLHCREQCKQNKEESSQLRRSSDSDASLMDDVEAMMYGAEGGDDGGMVDAEGAGLRDGGVQQQDEASASNPNEETPTLYLTCFHLPVILSRDPTTNAWTAQWSESLIANTDNVLSKNYHKHWVGTVSPPGSAPLTDADKDEIKSVLGEMHCTPLFVDREVKSAHYLGMCKQVLWPAFHNVDLLDLSASGWGQRDVFGDTMGDAGLVGADDPSPADMGGGTPKRPDPPTVDTPEVHISDWDQSRLDGWWEAYTAVNRAFADEISSRSQPGDIIWVHDYHLALLPQMLDGDEREKYDGKRATKMVFFLHIPFPTSQIFRELECGEAILEGMLQADVVGFHAFDHARHFLNAGKRILGLSYESLVGGLIGVRYMGRVVLVTISNVSIEAKFVDMALSQPAVKVGASNLRSKHRDRTIIAGVDVAQRLSGISLKLLAFERLLTDYPVWQTRVVLVQRCLVPKSRRVDELTTLRELRYLVRRIQEKFGIHVIDYEEVAGSQLPIEQRLALWQASDVLVMTPVRQGFTLIPMEYIYARREPLAAGVTLSSEFSCVTSILNGAMRVNPFDIPMTATLIDKALTMDLQEREGRRARDIDFVANSPSSKWSKNVLRDLNEATASSGEDEDEDKAEQASTSIAGFLAHEAEMRFSYVDTRSIEAAFQATSRRVLIMDFNGTLVVKEPPGKYLKREILGTSGFKPPDLVIKAVTNLCADPNNTVVVVSGDSKENVEQAIGGIPGLFLAASNGACFSLPIASGETIADRKWHSFDLGVNWEAVKQVALPVLSKYTARTNGSFVKLTHSSLGWSYYSADPEWGSLQASHLVLELEHALQNFDVRFVTLKGIVEVVPRRLNKGIIVKKVLREVASKDDGAGVDFIMCMGDDISDEKMFTSVFSFVAEMNEDYNNVAPSPPVIPEEGQSSDGFLMRETASLKCRNANNPIYAFTVAVGKKPTHASQYVHDARDVANVLACMTGDCSTPFGRSASVRGIEDGSTDMFA